MQIFFVEERQHWITTALIKGEVCIFDSCFNGKLTPSAEFQIAQMYSPLVQSNSLLVIVIPMQQQQGANNCGLFSIAAAYHACKGENLGELTFIEGQMRTHLSKCFERKKLAAFPKTQIQVRQPELQFLSIAIYC